MPPMDEGEKISRKRKFVAAGENSDAKAAKKRRRNRGKKGGKKSSETKVKLPATSEDFSANWKVLAGKISAAPAKRKRPEAAMKSEEKPPAAAKKPEIWFDDVDEHLLEVEDRPDGKNVGLVKEKAFKGPTKVIAMDCEMVGVNFKGTESILARVSIVNHFGHCILDKFVKPTEKVTDYRTYVSGIRPEDLKDGHDFKSVQKEVSDLIQGRILVGHALHHDLKVLFLDHPRKMIRDTAAFKPFRNAFGGKTPSLKNLTSRMIGVKVQDGEHSSVQDAQAAMRLYTMFRKQWEEEISRKRKQSAAQQLPATSSRDKATALKKTDGDNKQRQLQYQDSSDSD